MPTISQAIAAYEKRLPTASRGSQGLLSVQAFPLQETPAGCQRNQPWPCMQRLLL